MKIPVKVKKLFRATDLVAFGTADLKARPNVVAVYWKKMVGPETIILVSKFMKMSKKNVGQNKWVCLSFWNEKTDEGYKLKGIGKYHTKGLVYELGKRFIQKKQPQTVPDGVVEIRVRQVYSITPGPTAGKKLQ